METKESPSLILCGPYNYDTPSRQSHRTRTPLSSDCQFTRHSVSFKRERRMRSLVSFGRDELSAFSGFSGLPKAPTIIITLKEKGSSDAVTDAGCGAGFISDPPTQEGERQIFRFSIIVLDNFF